ncbi:unnamed protein product [Adineta steineri]|uniref:Peptidase C1A papain C-terminal domain-containing protein n=1 Tax=Adineta steineri TaxID=433720 RepID=A0A819S3V1_9BILA|nr:unnamed protein product [Adineta steineri]
MPSKKFLINRNQNQKFRINGLRPSRRLPHKAHLRQSFSDHVAYSPDQLPPKADLRNNMAPIENQSQIGSCSANCLAGAYEYLSKKEKNHDNIVSRLFIYYNGRVKEDSKSAVTDSGCTMTSAIEALEESGVCLESIWPYDISQVNTRPSDEAYQAATGHKITQAMQVNIDLNEMKSCLAQGFPFAFGLKLYTSFDQAAKTGVVPMPNDSDQNRKSDGSHALLAVGYSDQSKSFIVRNSWGEDWGDKGYCYIPYDYLSNSDYCFDVWTIRKVETENLGQDHWDQDDSTDYRQMDDGSNNDDDRTIEDGDDDDNQGNDENFNFKYSFILPKVNYTRDTSV